MSTYERTFVLPMITFEYIQGYIDKYIWSITLTYIYLHQNDLPDDQEMTYFIDHRVNYGASKGGFQKPIPVKIKLSRTVHVKLRRNSIFWSQFIPENLIYPRTVPDKIKFLRTDPMKINISNPIPTKINGQIPRNRQLLESRIP